MAKKKIDLTNIMSGVAESVELADSVVAEAEVKRTEAKSIKFDLDTCERLDNVKRNFIRLYGKSKNNTLDYIIYKAVVYWLDHEEANIQRAVDEMKK